MPVGRFRGLSASNVRKVICGICGGIILSGKILTKFADSRQTTVGSLWGEIARDVLMKIV